MSTKEELVASLKNLVSALAQVADDLESLPVAEPTPTPTPTPVPTPVPTPTPTPVPPPISGGVDPVDILLALWGNRPFSEQRGWNTQVMGNQYLRPDKIPNEGIHGPELPDGTTLRLGKVSDPDSPAREAVLFALQAKDPVTSSSKRSEIKFDTIIAHDTPYWIGVNFRVVDGPAWQKAGREEGLFGIQLHDSGIPPYGLYMVGPRQCQLQCRYTGSGTQRPGAIRNSPFDKWERWVFKVQESQNSGSGFLQAWVEGEIYCDYKGRLGYSNPPKDYFKTGLYIWVDFEGVRKVMVKNFVIVRGDPKYTEADVRGLLDL